MSQLNNRADRAKLQDPTETEVSCSQLQVLHLGTHLSIKHVGNKTTTIQDAASSLHSRLSVHPPQSQSGLCSRLHTATSTPALHAVALLAVWASWWISHSSSHSLCLHLTSSSRFILPSLINRSYIESLTWPSAMSPSSPSFIIEPSPALSLSPADSVQYAPLFSDFRSLKNTLLLILFSQAAVK